MDIRTIKEFFKDTIGYIIFIALIILIIVYIVSLQQVVGNSMNYTLNDRDVVILNKAKYAFFDIEYGDIVSVKFNEGNYMVKRVIGLPGDTVQILNNKLFINGEIYEESYLDDKLSISEDFKMEHIGYDEIPNNMYLVLGDNRGDSVDSRTLGLVKKEDIVGEVIFRLYPFNKIGTIK